MIVFQIRLKDEEDVIPCDSCEGGTDLGDVRPRGRVQDRGPYYFFLANGGEDKVTLPSHGVVTVGPAGVLYNTVIPAHEEQLDALPSTTVRWAWSLTPTSTFRFGKLGVCSFASMYNAARATTGQSDMRLYAHSVSDVPIRGTVSRRVPRVHPTKHAKICMVLQPPASADFSAEAFGHVFLNEHVVEEGGLVQLAWPVGVHEPGLYSGSVQPPCWFVVLGRAYSAIS